MTRDYQKEHQKRKEVLVFIRDEKVIGVFKTIKVICEVAQKEDSSFYKYNTLIRKKGDPLIFETKEGYTYRIEKHTIQ